MNQVVDREKLAVFAEEALVVDAQVLLHNLMEEKNVSRAELARRMGVSRPRVTQMLSDECTNFTVRLLARAAFALGEKVELDCHHFEAQRSSKRASEAKSASNVYWLEDVDETCDADVSACGHTDERMLDFVCLSRERLAA